MRFYHHIGRFQAKVTSTVSCSTQTEESKGAFLNICWGGCFWRKDQVQNFSSTSWGVGWMVFPTMIFELKTTMSFSRAKDKESLFCHTTTLMTSDFFSPWNWLIGDLSCSWWKNLGHLLCRLSWKDVGWFFYLNLEFSSTPTHFRESYE